MKNHILLLFSILLYCSLGYSQTKNIQVEKGQKIENSLSKEDKHNYSIALDSGQYVFGNVIQETVDVVVKIKDPSGKYIGNFDGPARGPENFQLNTEKDGTYQIEVSPFEENEGEYSFEILVNEKLATEPDKKVDQIMTPYSGEDVPGAAVMVMKDNNIIFSEAYGMANLTYDIPFTVETPTNIGSTSKQFTAFAIQLLADQGKLSLDDDIRKYFPELPDFGKTVSIRNLLTHTSGYREFLNALAMTGRDLSSKLDREIMLKLIKNQPELQNDPGSEWNYNNTGFALMAALVEKVTDTPFPQWMKENVFKPLEMNNTMVRLDQNQIVPNRAAGYGLSKDGGYEELQDLGGAMGAGGIYTTLKDLSKWINNFDDPKVGNKKILKEMMTPYVLTSGDTTNYGLGLFIEDYKGLKRIQHGGSDVAHRSMLMYFPEIDAAVITQSNNAGFGSNFANEIADIYFSEYMEDEEKDEVNEDAEAIDFDYAPENFEKLAGRYELVKAPGFVIHFKRDGDRIYSQATGQPELDLKAESDSVFVVKKINAKITFHLNEKGTADSLTLHQNGEHIAKKITWQPEIEELQEYTGEYFSDEIKTMYTISMDEEKLFLETYLMADKIPLTPADKDSFGAGFPISEISFKRNDEGKITGFYASNGRARNIFFEKTE